MHAGIALVVGSSQFSQLNVGADPLVITDGFMVLPAETYQSACHPKADIGRHRSERQLRAQPPQLNRSKILSKADVQPNGRPTGLLIGWDGWRGLPPR